MSTSIPVRRKNTQNTITSPPSPALNTQDLKSNVPQTEITRQDFQRQNPIISGMSSHSHGYAAVNYCMSLVTDVS